MRRKITKKEFLEFIFKQKRKKKIEMLESKYSDALCGCVMVHYGLENGFKSPICGYLVIDDEIDSKLHVDLDGSIMDYVPQEFWCKLDLNYGDVQDYLNTQDWVKEELSK